MNLAIYPAFAILSIVMPRKKNLWVFGCQKGYLDNTKYFFEYASKQNEFECYWLANSKEERSSVTNKEYKAVLKHSPKGYWLSTRANMSFICTGFSDVNRILSLKSNVINFWHGTPIKKIYLDSEYDLNRFGSSWLAKNISKTLMKALNSKISFYYASNSFERDVITKAAAIPKNKSLALGAPRFDYMRNPAPQPKIEDLKDNFSLFYLYAPTWREGNNWDISFKLDNIELDRLNKALADKNALLIVKPHPATNPNELKQLGLQESNNILYSDHIGTDDINDLYAYADLLITDVSSAVFDYLMFNKPILFFMPDINKYISGSRGVYNYFISLLKNHSITDWNSFISVIEDNKTTTPSFLDSLSEEISKLKRVNENIYSDIKKRFY